MKKEKKIQIERGLLIPISDIHDYLHYLFIIKLKYFSL